METFIVLFNSITSLFLCILLGVFCYKKNIVSEAANESLSNLLLKVTLPCLLVYSLQTPFSEKLFKESLSVLLITSIVFVSGAFLGFLLCKLLKVDPKNRGVYIFACMLPNVTYMGLPVILGLYGEAAIFHASIINVPFNVLTFTIGQKIITMGYDTKGKVNIKDILLNPNIIATIIGLLLFVTSTTLPKPINSTLSMIGNMTTPISMIVIGVILAKSDLKKAFSNSQMYIFIAMRLVIIPVIVLFCIKGFVKDPMVLGIIYIMCGMPAPNVTAILAKNLNANYELASVFVCMSIILSLFAVPAISILLP